MIDLGKPIPKDGPLGDGEESDGKKVYPTLYIRDIPELDNLPDGEFTFTCVGKVTSHSENEPVDSDERHCSCEISIISMKAPTGSKKTADSTDGLDSALSSIEKKKADDSEDEYDDGADEDTET